MKALFRGHRGEGRSVIGITSFLLLARARRSAQANSRKREVTTELMSRPGATLRTGQTYRIDVENPSPGVRPGQAHIQIAGEPKYVYNFNTGRFEGGLPESLQTQLKTDPNVQAALAKALKYLVGGR